MSESTDSGTQDLSFSAGANAIEAMLSEEMGDEEQIDNEDSEEVSDDDDQSADDDDSEESERQPTDEKHVVKVNGEEVEVSLDELKHGYMKDAYFRQVTAEAANERREAEAIAAQYVEKGNQLNNVISQYQAALNAVFSIARPDPAECFRADPSGDLYKERQQAFERLVQEFQQADAVTNAVGQQSKEAIQRAQELRRKQTERELILKIPEWGADRDAAGKELMEIGKYAREMGYTNDEISSFSAQDIQVMRDAAKWRQLQSKKPAAENKAKNLPPVKSGKAKATGKNTALDIVRKTGDKRAAHAAIMNLL